MSQMDWVFLVTFAVVAVLMLVAILCDLFDND